MKIINELNRWLAPPLIAVLLGSSMISAVSASTSLAPHGAPACSKERGRPAGKPAPPGQLVRRGVIGTFVGMSEDGNILVETQFGVVELEAPEGLDVTTLEEGSRIAALTAKEPVSVESGDETATDTPFRTGSALKLKIVPGKVTGSHQRGVVVGQDGDTPGGGRRGWRGGGPGAHR